jgi:hypothetical protein
LKNPTNVPANILPANSHLGVGIAVGVSGTIIGILIAAGLIWCLKKRRRGRNPQPAENMRQLPRERPRDAAFPIFKELKLVYNLGALETGNGIHQPPDVSTTGYNTQITRMHYGIEKTVTFNFGIHSLAHMLVGPDGVPRCSQVMHWYVQKVSSL